MAQRLVQHKTFVISIVILSIIIVGMAGSGYYFWDQLRQEQQAGFSALAASLAQAESGLTSEISSLDDKVSQKTAEIESAVTAVQAGAESRDKEILNIIKDMEQANQQLISSLQEEIANIDIQSGDLVPLVDKVMPSVVSILTTYSRGSGVVVDGKGRIITNFHVLEGAPSAAAVTHDGKTYAINLMAYDPVNDLALLNITRKLPSLELGNDVRVGQSVIAAGNPLGFDFSVTEGIVSGVRNIEGREYIQHSVAINPGSSGGPLINKNAEIVGINTFKIQSTEGIGFAIPAETVQDFYRQAIS